MPELDPRIDAYIEKSAAFAQPMLIHLRRLIHKACLAVTETEQLAGSRSCRWKYETKTNK